MDSERITICGEEVFNIIIDLNRVLELDLTILEKKMVFGLYWRGYQF